MADDKDEEIRQLRARLDAKPVQPPRKMSGCLVVVIAGALLVGGVAVVGALGMMADPDAVAPAPINWTAPEGYTVMRTGEGRWAAVSWSKPNRSECRSGVKCYAMNVVTEKGCANSLYASVKFLNASDVNIGWTNDTAQGVAPDERVRLVFTTYDRAATKASLAELRCY